MLALPSPALPRWPLLLPGRARSDHRQRNPTASLINLEHPHPDNLTNAHHIVRIPHVLIREVADVHKPAIMQADVYKGAKINYVEHGAEQFHAGLEIFEL